MAEFEFDLGEDFAESSGAAAAPPRRAPGGIKRKRKAPPRGAPKEKPIWKIDVLADPRLPKLRAAGASIAAVSQCTTAYFIPIAKLTELTLRKTLYDTLTTKPKSKKFQGQETNKPWPMWHERNETHVAVPRQFGLEVFGEAAVRRVWEGEPVHLTPIRPLFTLETCKEKNGIDQVTAVDAVESYLKTTAAANGFAGCLFCISPGYGKTCCSAHLISRLGRRTLFVVPNEKPFLKQVADEMRAFLGDDVVIGQLLTSNKKNWKNLDTAHIVIATAKSIATIKYDLTSFGLLVVDEVHEASTTMFSQMFFRFGGKYVLGLTATPERHANHTGGYLRWLVGPIKWHEKRDLATLRWGGVNVTVYDITYTRSPLQEQILKSGEPYWEGLTRQIKARKNRNNFVVATLLEKLAENRTILVLGNRIDHMEEIHAQLVEQHRVPTGIIVGEHSQGYRMPFVGEDGVVAYRAIKASGLTAEERLDQQKHRIIIATCSIVCKALNIPHLDTVVGALSGGSNVNETFWEQCIGRVTRDHPDKQKPEVVLFRDRYESTVNPGTHGVMASCVDAACMTMRRMSLKGFTFTTHDVELS